jgi:hypothetical protein
MADPGPSSRLVSVPRGQSLMPELGASNQAVCHFVRLVPIMTASGACVLRRRSCKLPAEKDLHSGVSVVRRLLLKMQRIDRT